MPFPFRTVAVTFAGFGACGRRLIPNATSRAFSGAFRSGWTKSRTAAAIASGGDDVLLDRVRDLQDGVDPELRRDLLLQRFQEELLACVAVDVRVEVPVADV